jgi:hypothetical protein
MLQEIPIVPLEILRACAEITPAISPGAQGSVHKQHYSFTLLPSFPSVQRFSCPVQTRLEQKATKATKSENLIIWQVSAGWNRESLAA